MNDASADDADDDDDDDMQAAIAPKTCIGVDWHVRVWLSQCQSPLQSICTEAQQLTCDPEF
jgi:hypothetical protein